MVRFLEVRLDTDCLAAELVVYWVWLVVLSAYVDAEVAEDMGPLLRVSILVI